MLKTLRCINKNFFILHFSSPFTVRALTFLLGLVPSEKLQIRAFVLKMAPFSKWKCRVAVSSRLHDTF